MRPILSLMFVLLATVISSSLVVAKENELPRAKLTVRVIDEAGRPVANAQVRIHFREKTYERPVMAVGETDATGEFGDEGYSPIVIEADVQKDGYYLSGTPTEMFKGITNGMWYPWNPILPTTLRKIENPIPMYAKGMRSNIPEAGRGCGYDLEAGDWVAPYGKGKISDFIFSWTNNPGSNLDFDATATLTFSNPSDGIQEADLHQYTNTVFRWPRQAPYSGYQPSFTDRYAWFTGGSQKAIMTFKPDGSQAYFFRVRTVEQDGKIVSALYGKIDGGIALDPSQLTTCEVSFHYYLNPTPLDRNMEFDLERNLFTHLQPLETPRRP